MANAASSPEKGLTTIRSVETSKLVVKQPAKLAELTSLLETFENLNARVSETTGEDRSGDMGGGGTGGSTKGDDQAVSARDLAIKRIPRPEAMREKLQNHIRKEVHSLERKASAAARGSRPGSAHNLNEIYARIRRLNTLLAEILEASVELLKRLFIRVFIDKQSIL